MARESATAYWGAHSAEYDEFIVRVVPRYREQLDLLMEYSPTRARRVLELGCGTGNVSVRLAERWPEAEITCVDGAPEMVELTRSRLEEEFPAVASRARFVVEQFEKLDLESEAIDVVIASFSLHHVADVSVVYDRIAPLLVRSGRLVMLDGLRGSTEEDHLTHMGRWASFWRQQGNLTEAEVRDVEQHIAQHDHYRSLEEHFEMLHAAGFRSADCLWRDGLFALVTAER